MSLTTSEMTPADFAAVTCGNNNDGFGNGDGWLIILFLILAMGGNWGNGFGGGNGGGNLYPWMNQAEITSDGFRDQMMNNNITSIRDGIGNLSTQICNGFSQAEIADNSRQMASMNQNFAMQSAMTQGFNNLASQFADCLKKIIKKAKDNLVFTKYTVGSCTA